jgi:hypothetical protein
LCLSCSDIGSYGDQERALARAEASAKYWPKVLLTAAPSVFCQKSDHHPADPLNAPWNRARAALAHQLAFALIRNRPRVAHHNGDRYKTGVKLKEQNFAESVMVHLAHEDGAALTTSADVERAGAREADPDVTPAVTARGLTADLGAAAELDRLGDSIAELAAHLHAATYRLLRMIAEFDRRGGWGGGFRSCAHWLSWRTRINLGAAREKVRVARALEQLPQLSDALRRGELSYAVVRAVTRIATSANESELLELARHGTASHVERVVRAWRRVDRFQEQLRSGSGAVRVACNSTRTTTACMSCVAA